MVIVFGQTGSTLARECRIAAQHFLYCGVFLWCVATFKSLLGATRDYLAWESLYADLPTQPPVMFSVSSLVF